MKHGKRVQAWETTLPSSRGGACSQVPWVPSGQEVQEEIHLGHKEVKRLLPTAFTM